MRFIEYMRRRKQGLTLMSAFEEAELGNKDDAAVFFIIFGISALMAAYALADLITY